jgi:two-component system, response regulator RegA
MERLLLVDDDEVFCSVLAQALRRRGFDVTVAHDAEAGLEAAARRIPDYALIDLCLPEASGLVVVERLRTLSADIRIVVLTGYASIATAVEAVKLGAVHYLTKPAEIGDIVQAFGRDEGDASTPLASRPMSVNRLEWEHIQKVLRECDGNVSLTARRLGMHRRTLQRKLQKYPVRH